MCVLHWRGIFPYADRYRTVSLAGCFVAFLEFEHSNVNVCFFTMCLLLIEHLNCRGHLVVALLAPMANPHR